ncbi:hypothetical protein [Methylobacterium aquaticum]|uniref:hypothetical protein n=1 Tax=Methylobacterium aquaticum TaxID=270351 RepID=UPI001931270B|nr:hypothetical protein [Methylobacterium aquaticum]QRE77333.1 hypothetical protein F1D61_30815 [Methylobacterium aquaticum]
MLEAGFLKGVYDSLSGFPVLQAAVGALIVIFGLRLMLKADKAKDAAAAPAAPAGATLAAPDGALHLQGAVAFTDMTREMRDILRECVELQRRIAECVRIMREEARKQTEILERIEREQDVQGRSRHP